MPEIRMMLETRWCRYDGNRIERRGFRKMIAEQHSEARFSETKPIYAYITPSADGLRFSVMYEILRLGEVIDVVEDDYESLTHAKRRVARLKPEDLTPPEDRKPRPPRYSLGYDLPPHSADGTFAVIDNESDNGDVLVRIDPNDIMPEHRRKALGELIAAAMNDAAFEPSHGNEAESTCRHCNRRIVLDNGIWIDPAASGDDLVWRETCDAHDTFTAEHEPMEH